MGGGTGATQAGVGFTLVVSGLALATVTNRLVPESEPTARFVGSGVAVSGMLAGFILVVDALGVFKK